MPSAILLGRAGFLSSSDLGNATTETLFTGGGLGAGQTLILGLPNNGNLLNRRFRVGLAGRVQTTTAINFTVAAYFGFGAIAANTLLFSSGSVSINGKTNWEMDLSMFWDGDGQTLNGNGQGQVGGSVLGSGALNASPSANPITITTIAAVSYGFTVTGLFGTSNTGNHAFVDAFDLELL